MHCRKSTERASFTRSAFVSLADVYRLAHQVRPKGNGKYLKEIWPAVRYVKISAPSCVNSNRSHTYPHRDPARDILPSGDSPPLRSVYISFTVSYSIVAVADDHTLQSRKPLLAISFPTWFMTHDLPRKKSH